jgi:hypothetical protein
MSFPNLQEKAKHYAKKAIELDQTGQSEMAIQYYLVKKS